MCDSPTWLRLLVPWWSSTLLAANLHVAPIGDDHNPGTEAKPFATLQAAHDAARPLAGREAATIHVSAGTYYLPETLIISSADSGSAKFPVIYPSASAPAAATTSATWIGATIRGIEDEEFSAFGTAKEDGGVYLVIVPADSRAARAGLAPGDRIQAINGQKTTLLTHAR